MPFKRRGKKLYFYQCRREGGRVVTDYFGCGIEAEVAAGLAEERQFRRQSAAYWNRGLRDAWRRYRELHRLVRLLSTTTLLQHGIHRTNYGPWRRSRRPKHGNC